ncbi:hypothetical protein ABMA27_004680 [Loxostege sticticalis]|uniref:THAP-type domain-containing protein n=1 Tax=Loxostege sticticalis TaxID=481309 RepID=A0ABR3HKC0_LOXSC
MTSRKYCAAFGCMNSSITHPEITFFKLPGSSERRLQWLQRIHRDDLENKSNFSSYRVCENHFNLEDVLQSPNRKLLKKNALPLLMPPSLASTDPGVSRKEDKQTQTAPLVVNENFTQTENATNEMFTQTSTSRSRNTPRKRKLKVERRKTIKLHETENKTQKDYIIYCLNLYYISPQAYRFLQSALCLPCPSTLYKHYFPITTEINERAMSVLKLKVTQMTELEKKLLSYD